MNRSIIHLNVADFAVAVERAVDLRLRDRPVIIAPAGAVRAAVHDMSQEAYLSGVRKGMPLRHARRRCRDAIVIAPHPDRYERAMTALLRKAKPFSPRIEPGEGDGHLFLDVTGTGRLFGPPMDVAWRLRKTARMDLGLDPIWSVAPNKLTAKTATRIVKPDGEYIVAPGEERSFLDPLPLELVPGIETVDMRRLKDFNLRFCGQVAVLSPEQLEISFGSRAQFLYEAVRGIDPSPVLPLGQKLPMLTACHEFDEDTENPVVLESVLYRLVEENGYNLRRRRRAARRVGVVVDYTDGRRRICQKSVIPGSANDGILFKSAREALCRVAERRVRIRYLQLLCDRLVFPPAQLELFPEERYAAGKRGNLMAAIDNVRERFGPEVVRMGRTLAA